MTTSAPIRSPSARTLQHLYVANEAHDSVITYARHPVTGELAFLQETSHDENLVSVWTRDPMTGHPALLEVHGARRLVLRQAFQVVLDASGDHLYAVGVFGNGLVVFDRDPVTGTLTEKQTLVRAVCSVGKVGEPCRSHLDCSPSSPPGRTTACATSPSPGSSVRLRSP